MSTVEKAMERLSGRMSTLDGLHKRGIVTGDLLRKQIKSLLSSRDAHSIYNQYVESEKKAIKILNRLEDPIVWRELFTKNRDERESVFYEALENIMNSSEDNRGRILQMLQLACLPFYSGFLPLNTLKKKDTANVKPSRVSVLD